MLVGLSVLWLPIVLSAVIVFFASFILHMVLTYHRSDYGKLPGEEKIADAIRDASVKPGLYMFPFTTHAEMKSPQVQERFKRGPVGTMNIRPNGPVAMGKYLAQWFVYCVLVSFFTAYALGIMLGSGAQYIIVFRIAGTVAFMAYGLSQFANGIWKGEPWGMVIKEIIDGLIYALLTAGTFGWLWPR